MKDIVEIRPYRPEDWEEVWEILQPVFRAAETYAVDPEIDEEAARDYWTRQPLDTLVAEEAGRILGTYYLKANHPGPGSHVCNCGYIVAPEARGRGIAEGMCLHSQELAKASGFRAMQFNLVVSSNAPAVHLWKKLGFEIVGRLPGAFRHPSLGFVDALVMFKELH
ncbi:N-acetyltransferase family protein [Nitratifractor sp.]